LPRSSYYSEAFYSLLVAKPLIGPIGYSRLCGKEAGRAPILPLANPPRKILPGGHRDPLRGQEVSGPSARCPVDNGPASKFAMNFVQTIILFDRPASPSVGQLRNALAGCRYPV